MFLTRPQAHHSAKPNITCEAHITFRAAEHIVFGAYRKYFKILPYPYAPDPMEWFFDPARQSDMGGCCVSKAILDGTGKLTWCIRHKSLNPYDTGWEFYADTDTEETSEDPNNFSICAVKTVMEIEPAVLEIFNMPVGADICLERDGRKLQFVYSETGEPIK